MLAESMSQEGPDFTLEEEVFSLARNVFLAAGIYTREDLVIAVNGEVPTPGTPEFYPPAETGAPSKVDRRGLYKLFELASALYFRVLPWECISPEVLVAAGARRNKNNGVLPDYGVDCASADLKTQLQAKWYKPGGRIPFTAVGTFGMYSEHLGVETRILVSSPGVKFSYPAGDIRTIRYETLAPEAVVELLTPALKDIEEVRPSLESISFNKVDPFLNSTAREIGHQTSLTSQLVTERERKLRPYQEEALSQIRKVCFAGGVHSVVMACGTGKTVIIAQLVATMLSGVQSGTNSCKLAILIPSLQLVSRFTAELAIWAQGIEYEVIKGGVNPTFQKPLLICINNSASKISSYQFDIVIVDEAHHVQGWNFSGEEEEDFESDCSDINDIENNDFTEENSDNSFEDENEIFIEEDAEKILEESSEFSSEFSSELSSEISSESASPSSLSSRSGFLRIASRLNCRTRLDFTATPKSEKTPCVSLGLREAIEAGILVDYWIDVPVFENADTAEQKAVNRKPNLARLVAEHPEWKKVLAYCNRIEEARIFAELLCERGVPAVSFSGKTSVVERERLIRRFESGEFRALVTVNVLGEGIDIPCADCCLFVEPRGSRINVIQCIGRVLRNFPGKKRSVVVLPTTEDDEHEVLRRFFAIILDEDAEYRKLRDSNNRKSESRGRVELNFSAGESLSVEYEKSEEALLLREEVYSRLGQALTSSWFEKLELLREFVAENKRLTKQSEKYRGEPLGHWISTQRVTMKEGKLSEEKIKLLESIDCWSWGVDKIRSRGDKEENWKKLFELLREFVAENGRLTKRSEVYKGEPLGVWIGTQRTKMKEGKLSEEKIKLLESIDCWSWSVDRIRCRGDKEENWKKLFELLREFVAENGLLTKFSEKYKGEPLGGWINTQRVTMKEGKLSEEKIKLLESIDCWSWGVDRIRSRGNKEENWTKLFELLREFVAENGRLTKFSEKYKEEPLGTWINIQRRTMKQGKLSEEKIKLLESIDYWSWGVDNVRNRGNKEENWKKLFELLREFVAENGRLTKRTEVYKGEPLGVWIGTQRTKMKEGKLSEEKIKLLESIDCWSWGVDNVRNRGDKEENWKKLFELLREFVAENGRLTKISEKYKEEPLGHWISKQRRTMKQGKLSEEKIRALESIEGWVWKVK